jgi:excisionase family DNA binding protein
MNNTYSVKQVADILGYSTNSIYSFLKEGRIIGIRLGKGRYRVTQEELNKILHLKKTEDILSAPSIAPNKLPVLKQNKPVINDSFPCLFDWFISLVSIVMGLTMILFVRNFEEFSKVPLSEFLIPIKINFLVAGIGLFVNNLFNRIRRKAFFISYLIIFINSLAYALFLFLGKDILGGCFFILASIIIFFHTFFNLKGSISFAIMVTIITVLSPVIMFFFPSAIDLSTIIKITGLNQNLVISLWSILTVIVNSCIWLFKKEKNYVYWICYTIITIGLGYFAYLYSVQLYWSRALIYVLLILFLFIHSYWDEITEKNQVDQKGTKQTFISIALIYLVGIGIIWTNQNNIRSYVQNELINKLSYGKNLVEWTISDSQNKLEILSKNKSLIEAVNKNNIDILDGLLKDIYLYSSSFRRVVIADEKGDLLTNYPYSNIDYSNIAFRDYFKKVQTEKKSYLSNIFQTSAEGQKRYVVSINVPILDEDSNFIGILIGSFDINSLSEKLGQVANLKDKEYFIVIDEEGDLIISPKYVSKLSNVEIEELVKNVPNVINSETTSELENKQLQIHNKITDQKWTIAIRRPLLQTYNFDKLTNLLILFSIVGFSLITIYLNIFYLNQ